MKVIGYYNSFQNTDNLEKLNLQVLTHINYAFLLPKMDGNCYFRNLDDVERIVKIAHERGIKVFVAIGGWCDDEIVLNNVFEHIIEDCSRMEVLIESIMKVVKEYNFDGVDVDWEYPKIVFQSQYQNLIETLSKRLHSINKRLSIAIYHSVFGEKKFDRVEAISDEVINFADWLNIMTYDCHEEENHSSLKLAEKCYNYWHEIRKVPREKVLIGIPFYAKPSLTTYRELLARNPKNAYRDFYGNDSFNGRYTVREKAYFARLNCGGVFVWAINYDSYDQNSLLLAIGSANG